MTSGVAHTPSGGIRFTTAGLPAPLSDGGTVQPPSGTLTNFTGSLGAQPSGTSAPTFRVGGAGASALDGSGHYVVKSGSGFALFEALASTADGAVTFTTAAPCNLTLICGATGGAQTGGYFTTTNNGITVGVVKNGSYERQQADVRVALHAATVWTILRAGTTWALLADYSEFVRWTDPECTGGVFGIAAPNDADVALVSIIRQTAAEFAATAASYPLLPHGTADASAVPALTGFAWNQDQPPPPSMDAEEAYRFYLGALVPIGGVGPFKFDITVPGTPYRFQVASHGGVSTVYNFVEAQDDVCQATITDNFGQTFAGPFTIIKDRSGGVIPWFGGSPTTFDTNIPNLFSNDEAEEYQAWFHYAVFGTGYDGVNDPLTISPAGQFATYYGPIRPTSIPPVGSYPLTLTRTGSAGPRTITKTLTCVAAAPLPPVRVQLDAGFSTASLPGDVAFRVGVTTRSNRATFAIVGGDGTYAIDPKTGIATLIKAAALGAASVDILVRDGLLARVDHYAFTVPQGTALAPGSMTFALLGTLDNGMGTTGSPGPVLVGSVSVAGMTNPTWSAQVDGEMPLLTYSDGYRGTLYAVPRAGNPLVADIYARWLSGQTYTVKAIAREGRTLCVATAPLVVAELRGTGPTITVTPGGSVTATTAPTWNEAMDAYWSDYAGHKGTTVRLPAGNVPLNPSPDGTPDFARPNGHGGTQTFAPGPYTLTGPADYATPAVLDFKGAPGGQNQGGLFAQGGDVTWRNIVLTRVGNQTNGGGNAGAFYKVGTLPFNLLMDGVRAFTSDNGFESGPNQVSTVELVNSTLGMCGIGLPGLTHNAYGNKIGRFSARNLLSFSQRDVHGVKSRARVTELWDSTVAWGQNSTGSACVDLPNGGKASILRTLLHKGAQNDSNTNIIQYGEESTSGNGPGWDVNVLTVDGNTFLSTLPPSSGSAVGIYYMLGSNKPTTNPVTGELASIVVSNNGYYAIPRDCWWQTAVPGSPFIDGGGNHFLVEYPSAGIKPIDPATGVTLAVRPYPTFGKFWMGMPSGGSLYLDALELETRIPAMSAVGRQVTQLYAYDDYGVLLSNVTFSLPSHVLNDGSFAVDGPTGAVKVLASNMPDSLRWYFASVTGTDSHGVQQTYTHAYFVVVGTGYVAPRNTAGGPVVTA